MIPEDRELFPLESKSFMIGSEVIRNRPVWNSGQFIDACTPREERGGESPENSRHPASGRSYSVNSRGVGITLLACGS